MAPSLLLWPLLSTLALARLQIPLSSTDFRIPTPWESAVQARRIYHLSSVAVISTTFPSRQSSDVVFEDAFTRPAAPAHLENVPIGLTEYYSPNCSSVFGTDDVGSPIIIAVNIATYVRNIKAGSNVTITLSWKPPGVDIRSSQLLTAAALPRCALIGHMEPVIVDKNGDGESCQSKDCQAKLQDLGKCFTRSHPDARLWLPGNDIHESFFARIVVDAVYWVGGFGDRAYIGWLDPADWHTIRPEDWQGIRLPGEN
jgi:hypothetical protein